MPAKGTSALKTHFVTILLFQAVLYAGIWLWNEYVATYITLIFPAILIVLLLLSSIADWIEPSRITRWYYILMIGSIAVPLLIGAIFYVMYDGRLDWLKPI